MSVRGGIPAVRAAPQRTRNSPDHFAALTGLRFWLALWVILYHVTGPGTLLGGWAQPLSPSLRALVRGGYVSVNVFFVLSGFVLARGYASTCWNRERLAQYGVRRFARIYPVYALSIIVMIPFIVDVALPWFRTPVSSSKSALLANYVLLLQGWSDKLPVNWNTPAWSLSCEIFFYAAFPLLAICIRRRAWKVPLLLIAAALVLTPTMRAAGVPDRWKPLVHFADFLIGVGTAGLYDLLLRDRRLPSGRGYWFYLPALAATGVLLARPSLVGGWLDLNSAVRPLCAVLILGLALGGGAEARLLSNRLAVHLGHASYAIYILHIPIMWWYKRWLGALFGVAPGGVLALIYAVIVIGLSSLVFTYFEQPVNHWFRQSAFPKRPIRALRNRGDSPQHAAEHHYVNGPEQIPVQ